MVALQCNAKVDYMLLQVSSDKMQFEEVFDDAYEA